MWQPGVGPRKQEMNIEGDAFMSDLAFYNFQAKWMLCLAVGIREENRRPSKCNRWWPDHEQSFQQQ